MIKKWQYSRSGNNDLQSGSVLVAALIAILVLTAIGIALSQLTVVQHQVTAHETYNQNAIMLAEAGIEQSVNELNTDDLFAGYTTPQSFFDNPTQGKGTFTTTITDNPDGKSKTILAVGEIYKHNSSDVYLTHKIEVTVVGTTSDGYSVSTGPGGLILGGSASITNSDVYVNGTITMTGASSIGTHSNPVKVDVANIACPTPADSTYPILCSGGQQPISLAWSTNVYGTVCATGQTSTGPNNNIRSGSGGEGLKLGCTAPSVSQPTYNRQAQIDSVAVTGSGNSNTYVCNSWPFDRTWPANLQLSGNVNIGGSCNITIMGDAHITGNLTIGGASNLRVADSVGISRPHIFVDGSINVGGSASMAANSSGTGMDFVSFKNATGNPAATPTGVDLYNSQDDQNITVGGAVNLAGMVFDAYWSKIKLAGSGNVGAAAGQTVDLSGAGTVVFGTNLSSGSKTWTITSYQRIF